MIKETRRSERSAYCPKEISELIRNDTKMQHFILMGKSTTIENVIEEAHRNSLLLFPRRWIVILTEPVVTKRKQFWDHTGPIFSVSDTAVVQREVTRGGKCGELKEGCQLKLAFETLRNAIRKVIDLPDYDFTNAKLKGKTKNRLITEMKVKNNYNIILITEYNN